MNKYNKIYEQLIKKARTRDYISKKYRLGIVLPDGPVEVHHIVPKSIGGGNEKTNLVVFTPKEHFIAHLLLTKIYLGNYKIIKAFIMMCRNNGQKRAEDYKILRESVSKVYSEQAQQFYKSENSRKIISDKGKEVWQREGYREKMINSFENRMCPEYKKTLSKAQKKACEDPEVRKRKYNLIEKHSKIKSKEWVEKITKINQDRMSSPEWKKWASDKYKGSRFDNRRKVLDNLTGIVYDSAKEAAKARGLKYEVVKKWLYKGIPKHNLVWLDEQEIEDGKVGNNSESFSSSSESSE